MRKSEIKVIFWDAGNVLMPFQMRRFITPFSKHIDVTEKEVRAVLFDDIQGKSYSPLFEQLECGNISPSQFFVRLTSALDRADHIDYETFADLWCGIFLPENTELNLLLERIAATHYMLSNTNHIVHSRYMANTEIVRKHFRLETQRVLSYRVGCMKPNPRIYEEALRRAGVPAGACLFVDDLDDNIEAFRKLGGHGIVYNAQHHPIEHLERSLRKHGVTIS